MLILLKIKGYLINNFINGILLFNQVIFNEKNKIYNNFCRSFLD